MWQERYIKLKYINCILVYIKSIEAKTMLQYQKKYEKTLKIQFNFDSLLWSIVTFVRCTFAHFKGIVLLLLINKRYRTGDRNNFRDLFFIIRWYLLIHFKSNTVFSFSRVVKTMSTRTKYNYYILSKLLLECDLWLVYWEIKENKIQKTTKKFAIRNETDDVSVHLLTSTINRFFTMAICMWYSTIFGRRI